MKKFRIIYLILIFLLPVKSLAGSGYYEGCFYQTGDKISVSVSGQVSRNTREGLFAYKYIVKSNAQSEQDVWVFKIILPEKSIIINAAAPTGWGGPGWSGKPTKYSQMREIKPPYWIGWTAPEQNMKPSETASGFVFETSFGLPGIVDYYAEGESVARCPEGMAVDFIPGYHDLTPYGPGIIGKTIGPTAPPADYKPIEFLNSIISMKHEAYKVGWIDNAGIEQSLDAKLDNAKKKLEQGNTTAANNILEAFLNEVEAQGCPSFENCSQGKHLRPEAYALLKYNVQYLIERL